MLRSATSADIDRVRAVSVAAGERFRSVDDPRVAAAAWNRPFYGRRGFRVLAEHELTDELRALRAREAAAGLEPDLRVVMRRPAR